MINHNIAAVTRMRKITAGQGYVRTTAGGDAMRAPIPATNAAVATHAIRSFWPWYVKPKPSA
jgi:hypothetical protein